MAREEGFKVKRIEDMQKNEQGSKRGRLMMNGKASRTLYRKINFLLASFLLIALLPGISLSADYNPSVTYPGIFKSDQLYRMGYGITFWIGSHQPASLKKVSCPEARKSLSQYGIWTGLLKKDGSCAISPESSEWALGNLLNYQAGNGETNVSQIPQRVGA
jgi:hypothetical protein